MMANKKKEKQVENPKHRDKAKEWQQFYEALSRKIKAASTK
jgi:hypothetical protein